MIRLKHFLMATAGLLMLTGAVARLNARSANSPPQDNRSIDSTPALACDHALASAVRGPDLAASTPDAKVAVTVSLQPGRSLSARDRAAVLLEVA